jgi:hypothetical protein
MKSEMEVDLLLLSYFSVDQRWRASDTEAWIMSYFHTFYRKFRFLVSVARGFNVGVLFVRSFLGTALHC